MAEYGGAWADCLPSFPSFPFALSFPSSSLLAAYLQAMAEVAEYGRAWQAAREHHMMLLIAVQRGVPATGTAAPPGFASSSRRTPGSQGAKK